LVLVNDEALANEEASADRCCRLVGLYSRRFFSCLSHGVHSGWPLAPFRERRPVSLLPQAPFVQRSEVARAPRPTSPGQQDRLRHEMPVSPQPQGECPGIRPCAARSLSAASPVFLVWSP